MTINAHESSVRIKDAWVLNKSDGKSITVFVQSEQLRTPDAAFETVVAAQIIDPKSGEVIKQKGFQLKRMSAGTTSLEQLELICDGVQLWDLDNPKLYHLRIEINAQEKEKDTRTIPFGFRWVAPSGIGTDALFRLNGRRLKLYRSISWGFSGLNGLFPTTQLAETQGIQP